MTIANKTSNDSAKKLYFCTFVNYGYLDRALAMLESMRQCIEAFSIEILCFDTATVDFFNKHSFPEVICMPISDFEKRQPDVAATKNERTQSEYFFTCTPSFICDVLERNPSINIITYIDADMIFYNTPQPIFELMKNKSIMATEHGFIERDMHNLKYGRFNAGWVTLRNNSTGKECAYRWRNQCVAWCFDRLEDNKFADQKYIDEWPELYADQMLIAPPSINCGPWSLVKNELTQKDETLMLNHQPLVAYHFQGLRIFSPNHFYLGYYFPYSPTLILKTLYYPYVRTLVSMVGKYNLTSAGQQQRYPSGNFLYKLITGYWIDKPNLSKLIWMLQRYILRLGW